MVVVWDKRVFNLLGPGCRNLLAVAVVVGRRARDRMIVLFYRMRVIWLLWLD